MYVRRSHTHNKNKVGQKKTTVSVLKKPADNTISLQRESANPLTFLTFIYRPLSLLARMTGMTSAAGAFREMREFVGETIKKHRDTFEA